jgi:hypothetical protein
MFFRNQTKFPALLSGLISLAVMTALTVAPAAYAQDKQGKRSLETSKSRPKENKPAQSGSQRVQEQTRDRTQRSLDNTSSARQQEKTNKAASSALRK